MDLSFFYGSCHGPKFCTYSYRLVSRISPSSVTKLRASKILFFSFLPLLDPSPPFRVDHLGEHSPFPLFPFLFGYFRGCFIVYLSLFSSFYISSPLFLFPFSSFIPLFLLLLLLHFVYSCKVSIFMENFEFKRNLIRVNLLNMGPTIQFWVIFARSPLS